MEKENYFSLAAYSFQEQAKYIKSVGRENSPEWHLANGFARMAQGLEQESRILESRLSAIEARLSHQ
jgi:hypothetical protein